MSFLNHKLRTRFPEAVAFSRRLKAKTWPPGSIVYYTGNRKNSLSPYNLQEGASGTESAVIYLTREWAKTGHRVVVYTNCGDLAGTYDGVEYVEYYKFNPYDQFDTLIILAHPYLLPIPVSAKKLCWDWHDVLGKSKTYPANKIALFDHIFAKSKYQRDLLENVSDAKFTIIPNGIDEKIVDDSERHRHPFKLIYASRYYRGLDLMLKYGWPIIKRHIPEAELHVYHGWVRRELQTKYDDWRRDLEALFQQDGVYEYGRVSQSYLIKEKATASIHYYACTYPEIDCISIRESAAMGCVPVTTNFAVFKEKAYCVRVSGDPTSPETQEAVAYEVIDLLKEQHRLEGIRQEFKRIASNETWQSVAKKWLHTLST